MSSIPLQISVQRAIAAARNMDRAEIVHALRELAEAEPGAVLTELLIAVDEAADGDAYTDVPATVLLPDPARSKALLRAVIAEDKAAILAWAPNNYFDLGTGLIALAAALSGRQSSAGTSNNP